MSGTKYDQDKAPIHLIPKESLEAMAYAFGYGAKKYSAHNFKKGIQLSRLFSSLMRHAIAFNNGEDVDSESGLPHTFHLLANAAMIEFMRVNRPEMDDRYKEDGSCKAEFRLAIKEVMNDYSDILEKLTSGTEEIYYEGFTIKVSSETSD